jgi:hypothetical protein
MRLPCACALALLGAHSLLVGCGGGSGSPVIPPPPPPAVSVSVTPGSTIAQAGTSVQFTATVNNSTNQGVTWSVNGVAGGSATVGSISSSGLYTAPADLTETSDVQIKATAQASSSASANATVSAFAAPVIGVRVADGAGEFFDRKTGLKFVPRGNNYVRLEREVIVPPVGEMHEWHTTLSVGLYHSDRIEAAFTAMEALGYNIVRVFLDCCGATTGLGNPSGDGVNPAYMANLADFMKRAKVHHIYVINAMDDLPKTGGYPQMIGPDCALAWPSCANLEYTTSGGVVADRKFWQDFIRGLVAQKAPMDALFGYGLRQEYYYPPDDQKESWAPLPLLPASGLFTVANGKTYDMADENARRQMMDESLTFWTDKIRESIQQLAPGALVGVGFVTGANPYVPRFSAVAASTADFIDGHSGPGEGTTVEEALTGWGKPPGPSTKPVMMGEFAARVASFPLEADAAAALKQWQVDSCQYGITGWLLWSWDTAEHDDLGFPHWYALRESGLVGQVLAPTIRPDPCVP